MTNDCKPLSGLVASSQKLNGNKDCRRDVLMEPELARLLLEASERAAGENEVEITADKLDRN